MVETQVTNAHQLCMAYSPAPSALIVPFRDCCLLACSKSGGVQALLQHKRLQWGRKQSGLIEA